MPYGRYLPGQLFLCAYVVCKLISPAVAKAGASIADTAQINTQLDSAWAMVKRHDPLSISKITDVLSKIRTIRYHKGEADALFMMARYFKESNQQKLAEAYYDSSYSAGKIILDKVGMMKCLNAIGIMKLASGEYNAAIDFFSRKLEISKELRDKKKMSDANSNIGLAYINLGNYPKALEFFFKSLKLDEEINYKEAIPDDLGNIADIYGKMGEPQKALEFHRKGVAYSRSTGNEYSLLTSLVNMGVRQKKTGYLREAEASFKEALTINEHLNDPRSKIFIFHNLGALYNKKGDYHKAMDYFNQSAVLADGENEIQTANNAGIAESYQKLGQYNKALEYALKSLTIAQKANLLEKMNESSLLLSNIYKDMKDFEQAFHYYKLHITYTDSLFNLQKARQLRELQAKYETEKKEQEIKSLSQENQLQDIRLRHKTTMQYLLAGGFLVFILLGLGIFRNHRIKQEGRRLLLAEQLKHESVEANRLKELDELKSRFFANVAHEFRTPLTLILGPVENLLGELKSLQVKNQLLQVKNNAFRLVQLVNQLLDLSKLEAGAVKLDVSNDDVILFLKNHTYAFQSLADQQKISLMFESDISYLNIAFDKDKLQKILFNLLSNALKFTPPSGRVKVEATIEKTTPGETLKEMLRINVSDSGPGIPEEDLPRVFNRFYQSNHVVSRTDKGSGIGLELTKELVEICEGTIDVKNNAAIGAEFSFTIPVREITEPVNSAPTPANLSPFNKELELALSSYTSVHHQTLINTSKDEKLEIVLVIEDNDDVRNFIVNSLNTSYQIAEARDGEEGVEKALRLIPDLIISDVMMPRKDGYEVCKQLKEDEKTSHIPIILLTSKADVESRIEGLQLGADDYLAKPFHTGELMARIKNLIEQRKKLQEKYTHQPPHKKRDNILPTKEQIFMEKLRGMIELHLPEEEYSVEDLSRDMAMDRTQLFRKVKALTNASVSLYIRAVRLEHAHRLLTEGMYNVSEVAYRVGFNSTTYFSTCFTEQYGFPPSELSSAKKPAGKQA